MVSENSPELPPDALEESQLSHGIRKRKPDEIEEEEGANEGTKTKFAWGTTRKVLPNDAAPELDTLLSSGVQLKTTAGPVVPKKEKPEDESTEERSHPKSGTRPEDPNLSHKSSVKQEDSTSDDPQLNNDIANPSICRVSEVNDDATEPVFKKRKSKHVARKGNA